MRLAYFPGCKIRFGMEDLGRALEGVMARLGVTLVELPFNCCGNPARGKNLTASVLAAVKNLALAQDRGLDILTPCQCCFGQLKHGMHWYATQKQLQERIDLTLADEGLDFRKTGLIQDPFSGRLTNRPVRVWHLLNFLYHDLDRVKAKFCHPFGETAVVLQQGCHALRPYTVTQFDNPASPIIFREVAWAMGLLPLVWDKETECCGDPVAAVAPDLALRMTREKLGQARRAGARYIVTACTHCQIQYERAPLTPEDPDPLPLAFFLGRALGMTQLPKTEAGIMMLPGVGTEEPSHRTKEAFDMKVKYRCTNPDCTQKDEDDVVITLAQESIMDDKNLAQMFCPACKSPLVKCDPAPAS